MEPRCIDLTPDRREQERDRRARSRARARARVGSTLDELVGDGAVVLCDRHSPGKRRSIDHIVIAKSAVWVIKCRSRHGSLERRDVGGWFRRDERLYVNGRDETHMIEAMSRQVMVVRRALGPLTPRVRPVLCFAHAERSGSSGPFELDGVLVTRPRALVEQILVTPASGIDIARVESRLSSGLPATH